MSLKRPLVAIISGFFFILTAAGCGISSDQDRQQVENVLQPSQSSNTDDIQPDIHTNVPPPGSDGEVTGESGDDFFDKKEEYDGFSDGLKNQIIKNMEQFEESNSGSGGGSDDEGDSGDDGESEDDGFVTLLGGTVPKMAMGGDCDVVSEFLCVDQPVPPDGFDEIFTTAAGLDLVVRMDLNQLAVFGASDPVAVVSVFNNDGGATNEILIMPEDVDATAEDDVGQFQTAVPLGGAGKFTVVVSAYRAIEVDDAIVNDLFSKMFVVYRSVDPEIEFIEARPVISGAEPIEGDPVDDGATVSSDLLQVKVQLTTPFSPGLQVRFENYDESGMLRSFDVVGAAASKQATQEGSDTFFTGQFVLHNGLNDIRIVASIPELEKILGPDAPQPDEEALTIYNFFGEPQIKIIAPQLTTPLIPQTVMHGQKVDIEFCYTMIPDRIATNSGGAGASVPEVTDECEAGDIKAFKVALFVNGREIGGDDDPHNDVFSHNDPSGVFTAKVTPDFGVNIFEVKAVNKSDSTVLSNNIGTFVFGVPVKLIEDGAVVTEDSFPKRGAHVDVDAELIEGDIQTMIEKFLARDEIRDLIFGLFKSTARKPGYVCNEYIDPVTGKPASSNGDTTIEFLEDTFVLGPVSGSGPAIELTHLELGNDMLELGVSINGMHGEADLMPVESTGNTHNGLDLNFLPITFMISRIDINIGVTFKKIIDSDGDGEADSMGLDIARIPGKDLFKIVGDGPLGKAVYINSNRNPLAAGMELLDWQTGLLTNTFNTIMGGTLLCGVEAGQNNTISGALGKAAVDIHKLVFYNQNFLRQSLSFELFGNTLEMDAALHLLGGEIVFDEEGIHIRNVPLRVNPGPTRLTELIQENPEGILGSVGRFDIPNEEGPQKNLTNAFHKLGLAVSEDVLNQALYGANLSGLLDLNVDAKFYADAEAAPSSQLLPNGSMFLTQSLDVNMDGNDQNDSEVPVSISIKTDPKIPPMLTFLNDDEIQRLSDLEDEALENAGTDGGDDSGNGDGSDGGDDGGDGSGELIKHFQAGDGYFRLTLSGLEIATFQQETKPNAASQTFCNVPVPQNDNAALQAKGFCAVTNDAKTMVPVENLLNGYVCPDTDLFTIPKDVGPIVSRPTKDGLEGEEPVPIYRVKLGLVVHGKLQETSREISATDRVKVENPELKNILRAKLVPEIAGLSEAYLTTVEVVENHTSKPDSQIVRNVSDFLKAAVGTHCSLFNEVKLPFPEKFEFDTEEEGLISDLGLAGVGLGEAPENLPLAFVDDNRMFLDVLVYADLIFTDEVDENDGDNGE